MFLAVAMAKEIECVMTVNFNLRLESAHFGQEGDILLPLTLPVVIYVRISDL